MSDNNIHVGASATSTSPGTQSVVMGNRRSVILQPGTFFSIPLSSNPTLARNPAISQRESSTLAKNPTPSRSNSSPALNMENLTNNINTDSVNSSQNIATVSETLTTAELTENTDDEKTLNSNSVTLQHDEGVYDNDQVNRFLSDASLEIGVQEFDKEFSQFKKRRYPTSKPFKCGQCENSFNQRIHLKKHMSKHTGKAFICCFGFNIPFNTFQVISRQYIIAQSHYSGNRSTSFYVELPFYVSSI